MKHHLIWIFCFALLRASGQNIDFTSYSVEEGLSQSQVQSIVQDDKGFLWVATSNGGMCSFNGIEFESFTTDDGLPSNIVNVLLIVDQTLWIGTNSGLVLMKDHSILPSPPAFKLIGDKPVQTIYRSTDGRVFIGTKSGLYIWEKETLSKDDFIKDKSITSIFEDHTGSIWLAGTNIGAIRITGNEYHQYSVSNGLPDNNTWCIAEDPSGNLHVGTDKGVCIFNEVSGSFKLGNPATEGKSVRALYTDNNRNFWTGTFGAGLFLEQQNVIANYTSKQGLSSDGLFCFFEDREGVVWLGTDGGGLVKTRTAIFQSVGFMQGLPTDVVLSITEDSEHAFWFGTTKGIARYANGKTTIINDPDLVSKKIWAVKEDRNKNIWIGSYGAGIFVLKNGKMIRINKSNGLSNDNVRCITEDRDGRIWVGTAGGLNRITLRGDKVDIKIFQPEDGLPADRVLTIFQDSKRIFWVGTSGGGIARFDGAHFQTFTQAHGLPENTVLSIAEDKEGNIWCATFGGVTRIQNDFRKKTVLSTITKKDGLSSNTVYLLALDHQGYLLIGTNNGIDKLSTSSYNNGNDIYIRHYGKAEGFNGIECNTNAVYTDHKGIMWFGTIRGAISYTAGNDRLNKLEPITNLTGIRLFLQKTDLTPFATAAFKSLKDLSEKLILPYNKNHVTFDFIGICSRIPQAVRYRFMLQGFDEDWSPITTQSFATYSNIPPGNYVFLVKSRNNNGIWNKEPVRFVFTVDAPFWKTWWFYSGTGLLFASTLLAGVKMRFHNLKVAKIKLEREVNNKTRELFLEKKNVEDKKKELENVHHHLTSNITYASNMQNSILSCKEGLKELFPGSFILFKPKDIISGDFYWFAKQGEFQMAATVDCTGHGVAGAFMSIIGMEMLNEIVKRDQITDPALVLETLHKRIIDRVNITVEGYHAGMDISFIRYNDQTSKLEFASSGCPLFHISEGNCSLIKGVRSPVGIVNGRKKNYQLQKLTVQPGDRIYFSTDGYCDQFGGDKCEKFLYKGMEDLLLDLADTPIALQEEAFSKAICCWMGNEKQLDDILVIGIEF
jgi:ligand-binding sensor domain-containing protein/serine phosphatase RsbU (regulator of sigma subunit)